MKENKIKVKLDFDVFIRFWYVGWLFTNGAAIATNYFGEGAASFLQYLASFFIWPTILGQIVFS